MWGFRKHARPSWYNQRMHGLEDFGFGDDISNEANIFADSLSNAFIPLFGADRSLVVVDRLSG